MKMGRAVASDELRASTQTISPDVRAPSPESRRNALAFAVRKTSPSPDAPRRPRSRPPGIQLTSYVRGDAAPRWTPAEAAPRAARRIGEMVMSLSDRERERISDAIRATEGSDVGRIVCVLARSSSEATALPIFIAAVLSLLLPWILVAFTALAVREILLLQAVAFVALAMLLCLRRCGSR